MIYLHGGAAGPDAKANAVKPLACCCDASPRRVRDCAHNWKRNQSVRPSAIYITAIYNLFITLKCPPLLSVARSHSRVLARALNGSRGFGPARIDALMCTRNIRRERQSGEQIARNKRTATRNIITAAIANSRVHCTPLYTRVRRVYVALCNVCA